MTTKEVDRSITELAEDAAELAARAVGCGLARLIDTYVPPRFAMRVAVVLLREVRALDAAPAAVPSPGTH
jgi:hypothetical protein